MLVRPCVVMHEGVIQCAVLARLPIHVLTDAKLDSTRKETKEFRMETWELLAEERGGDSEDYRVSRSRELEADSGDQ